MRIDANFAWSRPRISDSSQRTIEASTTCSHSSRVRSPEVSPSNACRTFLLSALPINGASKKVYWFCYDRPVGELADPEAEKLTDCESELCVLRMFSGMPMPHSRMPLRCERVKRSSEARF